MEHISNQLARVSQELAPQGSTPPATGEDQQLAVAVQSQKIKDAPIERLKEVLRLVMIKVGLRSQNWPEQEEKAVLIAHILTNYGGHTPEEILLAFEMAIAGKLDLDSDQVTCYENFSCLYVSNILNAYRLWAREAVKYAVPPELPKLPPSEDLNDITMQSFYDSTVEKIKEGKIVRVEFTPPMVYDWLDKKGTLKVSADEKKEYVTRAVAYHRAFLIEAAGNDRDGYKKLKEFEDRMMEPGKPPEVIIRLAKSMILHDHIKNEVSNESQKDRPEPTGTS